MGWIEDPSTTLFAEELGDIGFLVILKEYLQLFAGSFEIRTTVGADQLHGTFNNKPKCDTNMCKQQTQNCTHTQSFQR